VRGGSATYAQYILKQEWLLMPIADDMPMDLASLACCGLGPSFGAMQRLGVDGSTTLLIIGAGPVGLGAVINASVRGARIIVLESVPFRIELAARLGAHEVLDPRSPDLLERVRELTDGVGVDRTIECSGTVAGERMAIDATRRRGNVAFVGENHDDLVIRATPDLITKGLTLMGSWHYNLGDYGAVLDVIRAAPEQCEALVTDRFGMSEIQTAFERSASRESAKIVVDPWRCPPDQASAAMVPAAPSPEAGAVACNAAPIGPPDDRRTRSSIGRST
jgi:L-iditol 2-dehydrogenase